MHHDLFFKDIQAIQTAFTEGEWVTVFEQHSTQTQSTLVYACLVKPKAKEAYLQHDRWEIQPGAEERPALSYSGKNGTAIKYRSFAKKDIEPFIFSRSFTWENGYESRVDISEEFILYFNLYEKTEGKQRRYFFIDALGRLDEVITVEEEQVKIKLRYLVEYISLRKMHLALCFDLVHISGTGNALNEETIETAGGHFFYRRQVNEVFSGKRQERLHGKTLIEFRKGKPFSHRLSQKSRQYAEFVTGHDQHGQAILQDCRTEEHKYLVPVYFRKKVLDKYLQDASTYKVSRYSVRSNLFSLKMDDGDKYVTVYLIELGHLPYKEQQHWKKHNVWPLNAVK